MKANPFTRQLTPAFSFLTIFFPKARGKEVPARSLVYFPLVGLSLGLLLWLCAFALEGIFYPAIIALLLLVILTICTRGLPLAGLGSLLDAAGIGKTPQQAAKAVRAHQPGGLGVIAICLALLAKYLLMSQLIEEGALPAFLLFPTLGRWSMVCLVWFFPEQQEKTVIGPPAPRDLWWAAAVALACAVITQGLTGLGIVALVWIFSYALGRYAIKKVGGITSPVMGAAAELVELFSLVAVVALLS